MEGAFGVTYVVIRDASPFRRLATRHSPTRPPNDAGGPDPPSSPLRAPKPPREPSPTPHTRGGVRGRVVPWRPPKATPAPHGYNDPALAPRSPLLWLRAKMFPAPSTAMNSGGVEQLLG